MNGLPLSTIRALCVLACLLLPVLTWSESFLNLVKEADAATVPSPDGNDGLQALLIADAAARSLKEGRSISL